MDTYRRVLVVYQSLSSCCFHRTDRAGAGAGHGSELGPAAEAGRETKVEGERSATGLGGETETETEMQQPTAETPGTGGATTHATGPRETAAAAPLARGTGVEMKEIARGAGIATPSTTRETEVANREARGMGGKLVVLQNCIAD